MTCTGRAISPSACHTCLDMLDLAISSLHKGKTREEELACYHYPFFTTELAVSTHSKHPSRLSTGSLALVVAWV